jgi:hypothetical protein
MGRSAVATLNWYTEKCLKGYGTEVRGAAGDRIA